jgi:hypothetical protein
MLRRLRRKPISWADLLRAEYILNGRYRRTIRGRLLGQIRAGKVKQVGRGLYRVA